VRYSLMTLFEMYFWRIGFETDGDELNATDEQRKLIPNLSQLNGDNGGLLVAERMSANVAEKISHSFEAASGVPRRVPRNSMDPAAQNVVWRNRCLSTWRTRARQALFAWPRAVISLVARRLSPSGLGFRARLPA
jgi:hypothetical protein